jgi:cell division protein FtsB
MSYKNIQSELERKKIEYQDSLNDTAKIQNKIDRLKFDNLDLDLFEEEFKKNTGFVSENEIVIFITDEDKK